MLLSVAVLLHPPFPTIVGMAKVGLIWMRALTYNENKTEWGYTSQSYCTRRSFSEGGPYLDACSDPKKQLDMKKAFVAVLPYLDACSD